MPVVFRKSLSALWLVVALLASVVPPVASASGDRLVFGSFRSQENADNWAARLSGLFGSGIDVERVHRDDGLWYRVRSAALTGAEETRFRDLAEANDIAYWPLRGTLASADTVTSSEAGTAAGELATDARRFGKPDVVGDPRGTPAGSAGVEREPASARLAPAARPVVTRTDLDLGLQSRSYFDRGLQGQNRFQPSLSARVDFYRAWDDESQSLTFSPFARLDSRDDERTHFDLRELFWSRVADDCELHVGFKQVFWGVTEFYHLADIINQTDLVEDIDGEDKLGQPMVHLSLTRDWGIVDLFMLTGFRERTFPGRDGRLRPVIPVDVDRPIYESGAEDKRIDGAVRWSHHWGPLNFGLYHFSGTGRDPGFQPRVKGDGDLVLRPVYRVIDQTGFDGQAIFGDWLFKLEAISRSGDGDRYAAATGGFERTLVGAFGSRSDLGLIMEYIYDERGEDAYNTFFEGALALGSRWTLNDVADTQALLGVIWDVDSGEYTLSLEASRQLGASWMLLLEGRVFGGVSSANPEASLEENLRDLSRFAALEQDDYLQLEFTRYF